MNVSHDFMPPAQRKCSAGWDLHTHTIFSDGTETPENLIVQAQKIGLQGVAITDHDTTAGWHLASTAAQKYHFPLIRGTEITADYHTVSVHVLAYLYEVTNQEMIHLFLHTRAARRERTKKMVQHLAQDFPITWDDVVAQTRRGEATTIGRPHIADALVAAGVYSDRTQAFNNALSRSSKYFIPVSSPSVLDVIRAVKSAGGVVFIAHPAATSRNTHLLKDQDFDTFSRCGLDGIEVAHRDNSAEQQKRLTALAHHLGLLISGGSDWHGTGKPNQLGENITAPKTVQEIIKRGSLPVIN